MSDLIRLYVDDERTMPAEFNLLCRGYDSAIQVIFENWKSIECISLDHDLGETLSGELEKSGYDIVCEIEKAVIDRHFPLNFDIKCHSANPVGRKRINQVIFKLYNLSTKE